MLSFCLLKYERVAVDAYPGGAEAPVLFDSDTDTELHDAGIILTYLAREYDIQWMPQDHAQEIARWLAFAATDLAALNTARRIATLGAAGDLAASVAKGRAAMRTLEDALTERGLGGKDWLAGDRASIADIAAFPAVALSHDSGVGHEDYPAINLWQRRVRKLRGFVGMPGVPDYF
jgi:glutathione S-transferase